MGMFDSFETKVKKAKNISTLVGLARGIRDDSYRSHKEIQIALAAVNLARNVEDIRQVFHLLLTLNSARNVLVEEYAGKGVIGHLADFYLLQSLAEDCGSREETIEAVRKGAEGLIASCTTLEELAGCASEVRDNAQDGSGSAEMEKLIVTAAKPFLTSAENAAYLAKSFCRVFSGKNLTIIEYLKENEAPTIDDANLLLDQIKTFSYHGREAIDLIFRGTKSLMMVDLDRASLEGLCALVRLVVITDPKEEPNARQTEIMEAGKNIFRAILNKTYDFEKIVSIAKSLRTRLAGNLFLLACIEMHGVKSMEEALMLSRAVHSYDYRGADVLFAIVESAKKGDFEVNMEEIFKACKEDSQDRIPITQDHLRAFMGLAELAMMLSVILPHGGGLDLADLESILRFSPPDFPRNSRFGRDPRRP